LATGTTGERVGPASPFPGEACGRRRGSAGCNVATRLRHTGLLQRGTVRRRLIGRYVSGIRLLAVARQGRRLGVARLVPSVFAASPWRLGSRPARAPPDRPARGHGSVSSRRGARDAPRCEVRRRLRIHTAARQPVDPHLQAPSGIGGWITIPPSGGQGPSSASGSQRPPGMDHGQGAAEDSGLRPTGATPCGSALVGPVPRRRTCTEVRGVTE
jgi:hypothetical protein